MAIEIPKINWFEGLSPLVKCANCSYWKRNYAAYWDPEPSLGECSARGDKSCDDFYCRFFELKHDVNVG